MEYPKSLEEALNSITEEVATVVLNEAKSGNFLDGDLPETGEERIKEANYWVEEAYKGHQNGMRENTVVAILNCVGALPDETTEWKSAVKAKDEPGYNSGTPPRSSGGYSEQEFRDVSGPINSGEVEYPVGATGITGIVIIEPTVADKYNLPVPEDWEGDLIDMPRDISEVSDKEVRKLSGAFNAYLSRVKWLLALEISDLASAAHLRDAAFRKSLKNVDKVDGDTKKTKLKELIDAEAKESAEWLKLDDSVKNHQKCVTEFKALQEIYSGNIDRLSREWTMRQDEYEKTK